MKTKAAFAVAAVLAAIAAMSLPIKRDSDAGAQAAVPSIHLGR